MNGAGAVRVIETDSPQATWTAAQQAADFPSGLPAPLTIRVAQVSETYGPGAFTTESINV